MGIFLGLVIGHFIADCLLQPKILARHKRRCSVRSHPRCPPWPYWLTAHALVHGAAVTLITGWVWLGIAETVAHWLIDYGKCEGHYGLKTDQSAHLACKLAWFWMI